MTRPSLPARHLRIGLLSLTAAAGAGLAPPCAEAQAAPSVVAPAGHVQAVIVSAAGRPAHPPAEPREIPLRVRDPAAYARAKRAAASRAGRSSARTLPSPSRGASPQAPSSSARTAVVGALNAPGLDAAQSGGSTPPDTTGAIGPADYIEIVNSEIAVYDRTDLTTFTSAVDTDTFTGGTSTCDVQVKYDPGSDRWFFLALRCDGTTNNNQLYVGWSKTNDPSDLATGWCTFAVSSDPATSLDDYPKLGLDGTHVIIGANNYNASSGAFQTAHILVGPKPPSGTLGSCNAPNFTVFGSSGVPLTTAGGNFAFTPQPATISDATSTVGYVVAADLDDALSDQSGSHLMVWQIGGTSTVPTLLSVGDVAVPSFAVPPPVSQPGSTDTIDSLDGRLTQAVEAADPNRSGAEAVWTQHTIADGAGGSVVRWYEVVPATSTLVQSGNVGDRAGFAFNGAIAPTLNGGAVIDYNTGGPNSEVQLKAQSRLGTDPLGTMSGPVTLATSSAIDADFSCPSQPSGAMHGDVVCRWGDYAGASADPTDPSMVWGSNQVNGPTATFFPGFGHNAQWATENFALTPTATPAPTASFSATPNPVTPGSPATFDGSGSSDSGDVIDYRWSFGDGTSADTGGSPTVTHAYGLSGPHSVQLTVTHSGGRTASTTQTVIVDQPSAAFTASPNPAIPGATVAFDGSASGDAAGTITAYTWSFGDGGGASGATASHSFAVPGSYVVTLTVTNNHGQTAATTHVLTVNAPPAAAFTIAPNPARAGTAVSFDASGSAHPAGLSAAFTWSFGDGGTAGGPVVSHRYNKPGTYAVTLTVVDGDGQSATTIEHLLVKPPLLRGRLAIRGRPTISGIRKHGLGLTLSSTEAGRATFTLIARLPPKRPGGKATTVTLLRGRTIAVASGSHGVTLKLSRAASRALGGARSISVKVIVTDAFAQKLPLSASHPL